MTETRTIKKLEKYISKLQSGQDVDLRALATLGLKETYQDAWQSAKKDNAELTETPFEFKPYLKHLRKGDAFETAADKSGKEATRNQAVGSYERAVETLSELLSQNPALAAYLDRPFYDTPENCPSLCRDDIPRLYNSKSHHCLTKGQGHFSQEEPKTKRDVKLEVLEGELERLKNPPKPETPHRPFMLKGPLIDRLRADGGSMLRN